MNFHRALMVTKKIFWTLKHDRRSMALIILAPILAMLLFGVAFSGEVREVDVIVVNLDGGYKDPVTNQTLYLSKAVLEKVDRDVVNIRYMDDVEKAIREVEKGDGYSVVVFPGNFTYQIMIKLNLLKNNNNYDTNVTNNTSGSEMTTDPALSIHSDQTNVNVASAIQLSFREALMDIFEERSFKSPASIDTSEPVYGKNAEFIDMFVPGIIGFAIFMLTTILTLITFVGEKTQGTLQRLLATPVTEGEIVIGYAAAFSVTGMIQVGILMGLAIVVFDIMVVGNPLLAFIIASMLAVVSISLGILLSSAAHRESQAIQFLPLIILPAFLLSGIFWPLEAIPVWLRPASYFIPVTYAIKALRSVLLRGWGLTDIWLDLFALAGFILVFLTGAVLTLKRTRSR